MLILGIDTSCDDTGVGLVRIDGGVPTVVANAVWTQMVHAKFGGVMPELASREHVERIDEVTVAALNEAGVTLAEVDAVAATHGPGLVGALLVGLLYGKGLAQGLGKPFYAVHHLEGHIHAAASEADLAPPYLALVVSGGHTHLFDVERASEYKLVGATRDDAAGEAFDKVARLLDLGFPGGPAISRAAASGDGAAVPFTRPLAGQAGFDFSFSGLKTAALLAVRGGRYKTEDIAASFERAVVDALVTTTVRAARKLGRDTVVVSGGVAANTALREAFAATGLRVFFPGRGLNTDNGAMIALAGAAAVLAGRAVEGRSAGATAYLPLASR